MNAEKSSRQIILEINDAKIELSQAVNHILKKLPCFLVQDILDGILVRVREGAMNELAAAREQEIKAAQDGKTEE